MFNDPSATSDDIAKAGEKMFCELYGSKKNDINTLRYEKFAELISKSSVDLAMLPPTASAAKYHSLRVYYQVQKWMFNELNPTHWGWEKQSSGLVPITTHDNPAPDDILKVISCKCKFTCKGVCTCIKAGLKCTALCIHCIDKSCNGDRVIVTEEADFDVDTTLQMNNSFSNSIGDNINIPKPTEETFNVEENYNVPSCSGLHRKQNKKQKVW